MMMFKRRSIVRTVSVTGTGLHSGVPTQVVLHPAEAGHGIVLRRTDVTTAPFVLDERGALLVKAMPLCTLLENTDGVTLSTVEHLMAALAGLGVTDLAVDVDGPEVPMLDGSALPWVTLLDQAGIVTFNSDIDALQVNIHTLVEEKGRLLEAQPDATWRLAVGIEFAHPAIGSQRMSGVMDEVWFRTEVAPARTFVVEKDLKTAQAWGMAKGASLAGGVLFGDDGTVVNPEGLRFADEPVRHKMLDAIGDLYVCGRPWQGAFTLVPPGHAATNGLLRRLVAKAS